MLNETPAARLVISLGLAPGEPVIRLERVGLNLADFELSDNEGLTSRDTPVSHQGAAARWASLPLRRIEAALLANGIPARLSETAGTYLCNACLYGFLEKLESQAVPCGFIHVPMTPDLAAEAIARRRHDGMDRLPPPSMSLDLIVAAVRIAIAETVAEGWRTALSSPVLRKPRGDEIPQRQACARQPEFRRPGKRDAMLRFGTAHRDGDELRAVIACIDACGRVKAIDRPRPAATKPRTVSNDPESRDISGRNS